VFFYAIIRVSNSLNFLRKKLLMSIKTASLVVLSVVACFGISSQAMAQKIPAIIGNTTTTINAGDVLIGDPNTPNNIKVDAPSVNVPVGAAQVLPGALNVHGNTMVLDLGAIGTPLQQSSKLCGTNAISAGTGGVNVVIGLGADYCDYLKKKDRISASLQILKDADSLLRACPDRNSSQFKADWKVMEMAAELVGGKIKHLLPKLLEETTCK
jgi:hypothetical protein